MKTEVCEKCGHSHECAGVWSEHDLMKPEERYKHYNAKHCETEDKRIENIVHELAQVEHHIKELDKAIGALRSKVLYQMNKEKNDV